MATKKVQGATSPPAIVLDPWEERRASAVCELCGQPAREWLTLPRVSDGQPVRYDVLLCAMHIRAICAHIGAFLVGKKESYTACSAPRCTGRATHQVQLTPISSQKPLVGSAALPLGTSGLYCAAHMRGLLTMHVDPTVCVLVALLVPDEPEPPTKEETDGR